MTANRKKVLLVDDNKAEADLTRIIYREQNLPIDIIHFANGEEFLSNLPSIQLDEVCYVLLDLNMPRVSGYEVLDILSNDSKWKNIVVIVFSSSSNDLDVLKCYELGAKAYVNKPLDLTDLENAIKSIHGFWYELNLRPISN